MQVAELRRAAEEIIDALGLRRTEPRIVVGEGRVSIRPGTALVEVSSKPPEVRVEGYRHVDLDGVRLPMYISIEVREPDFSKLRGALEAVMLQIDEMASRLYGMVRRAAEAPRQLKALDVFLRMRGTKPTLIVVSLDYGDSLRSTEYVSFEWKPGDPGPRLVLSIDYPRTTDGVLRRIADFAFTDYRSMRMGEVENARRNHVSLGPDVSERLLVHLSENRPDKIWEAVLRDVLWMLRAAGRPGYGILYAALTGAGRDVVEALRLVYLYLKASGSHLAHEYLHSILEYRGVFRDVGAGPAEYRLLQRLLRLRDAGVLEARDSRIYLYGKPLAELLHNDPEALRAENGILGLYKLYEVMTRGLYTRTPVSA